jgi:hypothetical protein
MRMKNPPHPGPTPNLAWGFEDGVGLEPPHR